MGESTEVDTSVRQGGVEVEKQVDTDGDHTMLSFDIDSSRDESAQLRVSDRIPDSVGSEQVTPEDGDARVEDEAIVIERRLEAGETAQSAVQIDGPVSPDRLDNRPTIHLEKASGEDQDTSQPVSAEDPTVCERLLAELQDDAVSDETVHQLQSEIGLTTASTEARIKELQSEVGDLQAYSSAMEELIEEGEGLRESVEECQEAIDEHEDAIQRVASELQSTRTDLEAAIDEIEDSVGERIEDLDARQEAVEESVETLESGTESMAEAVEDRCEELSSQVDAMEGQIDALQEQLSEIVEWRNQLANLAERDE